MNSKHSVRRLRGWRRAFASLASLALGWGFALAAVADEVKVFAVDAFKPVVEAMAPVFAQRTGHRVVLVHDTEAALARRILSGEAFDLAVLPPALLEDLGKEGAVSDGSIIPLARVPGGAGQGAVYAGAVSTGASNSNAALSMLILLASEDTQLLLKDKGLAAP